MVRAVFYALLPIIADTTIVEMRLILATTLWHFDLELSKEDSPWNEQKVFVLWEKKPLVVKVNARS